MVQRRLGREAAAAYLGLLFGSCGANFAPVAWRRRQNPEISAWRNKAFPDSQDRGGGRAPFRAAWRRVAEI